MARVGAREQMIDAAERLAAEQGMAAMSLREVQAVAGQRNKSAAQYHFGSRQGLIEAIAGARMGPINEERRRRLDDLDAGDEPATTRQLMEVMVEPLAAATLRPGSCWARFLAQGYTDPELSEVVRRSFEGIAYRETRERLIASIVHVPAPLRERRVDHAIGVLVLSLAAAEARRAGGGAGPSLPVPALVADLVDTCTALVDAPASTRTTVALRTRRSA
jgi:AcrR family transcriptional regulator